MTPRRVAKAVSREAAGHKGLAKFLMACRAERISASEALVRSMLGAKATSSNARIMRIATIFIGAMLDTLIKGVNTYRSPQKTQ